MNLSSELSSLRIDRQAKPRRMARAAAYAAMLVALSMAVYLAFGRITAVEVETIRPTVQKLSSGVQPTPILTASGYIVARRKAVVSAKLQGRLAELDVDEGSRVTEGQVIARLDNDDYRAQIEVARAQVQRVEADLAEQQRQLRITQSLAATGVVSRDQLETVQSRVLSMKASLEQSKAGLSLSEANFDNTFIRAPFSGVVVKKMAEVGESVAPIPPGVNLSTSSGAIVSLADMTSLEAEVDISESNIARLQPDQPAQVVIEAFPVRIHRAVLREVIPTADRTKATITVKVTILEKDRDLRPEMSAKVTFLEKARKDTSSVQRSGPIITVSQDAVVTRNGASVVFEVDDRNKIHVLPVLLTDGNQSYVTAQGLSGSETLVRHPPGRLKDGDTVRMKR